MDTTILAQTVFSGFANGAFYAFIGLGFAFISRSTGVINFAQGDLAILGIVITAWLSKIGLALYFAAPAAILACGLASAAFYLAGVLPAKRATMSQLVIITIGFSILIRGAVTTLWGSAPMTVTPFSGGRPFMIFGVSVLPQELWLLGALALTTVAMVLFFSHTIPGLSLRAAASNPLGALYVGIEKNRLGLLAFTIAGVLAALGGIVWAPISYGQVDLGVALTIKGFTAAVLGGLTSSFGAIVGGLLLGVAEALITSYLSSGYQEAITFGLLLIALVFRPQGLLSAGRKLFEEPEALGRRVLTLKWTVANWLRLLIAGAVLLALGLVLPTTLLTTAIFAGIDAIVVIGLVLLTGYAGQLSLGQGTFMMIGGYASGYLTLMSGWPPMVALAVGAIIAGVVALALGRVIFRLRGYYMSMASLCVLMITLTLARELTWITGGPNGLPGIPPFALGAFVFASERSFYFLVVAALVLVIVFATSVTHSRIGRALLAVRSDESAALACGVDVAVLKTKVFALSAVLASIAGSLYVHHLGLANPAPFGLDATVAQIIALVLGGMVSLLGSVVGAAVVVLLPGLIVMLSGSAGSQQAAGLQLLAFGVLLCTVVIVQSSELWARVSLSVGRRLRLIWTPTKSVDDSGLP